MPLTPSAHALAEQLARAACAQAKAHWRDKLLRIQSAISPALRNSELSAAMGLPVPAVGQTGASLVGRWVSPSKRLARSIPGPAEGALIDLLLQGSLHIAVRAGGHRREVLLCTDVDLKRLGRGWQVVNVAGLPVSYVNQDWEGGWDLFGSEPAPPPVTGSHPLEAAAPRPTWAPLPLPGLVLGCMRLSTQGRPSDERAQDLLKHAADQGVLLFDSADVYALDEEELHHNHYLLARALRGQPQCKVLTKVGMARPNGRWRPDNRPERLLEQARRAREALEVESIALLQLHVVDKRVPLDESLGALKELLDQGVAQRIGLCNVSAAQLHEALKTLPISALQVAHNPWESKRGLNGGVIPQALALGIPVLAHSALGGHKRTNKPLPPQFVALARELGSPGGCSPRRLAVAWGLSLGHSPIVGATRMESLRDTLKARDLSDPRIPALLPGQARDGEVRLVMGPPASGKSQYVRPLVQAGWQQFNRDTLGGSLLGVSKKLREALEQGARFAVLDNTYPDAKSRAQVIAAARDHGLRVRVQWLQCPQHEAGVNACLRMVERHGRVLSPEELREETRRDPNMFPPIAISKWFSRLDKPHSSEGITVLELLPFVRDEVGSRGAILFDYDGTLRISTGRAPFPREPDEVRLMAGRERVLGELRQAGWLLLGVSNQGGIEQGQMDHERTQRCFERTHKLLGQELVLRYSPHVNRQAWDRKPNPGMGVMHMVKHGLDRRRCLMVGDRDSDREFAKRLGVAYSDQAEFFGDWREVLEGIGLGFVTEAQ